MSKVINDLLNYGYKIVQNTDYFKFSLDSILLADFVKIDYCDKNLIDLCTGNGPLPIILSKNIENITSMELQEEVYNLAKESIEINGISNINLINANIKNWKNYIPGNNFDIVTCNPPYFKYDENSIINDNKVKSIARHEIEINLDKIISISNNLLRDKGKFYIVYRTERMMELLSLLNKYSFGVKRMCFAYDNEYSNCSLVLIEAKKNSKDNLVVEKPLFTANYRGDL